MNRKKGIIIGTTGIIIVTLALIGFTYGFYLSLISGNETSKKVKITAGKSKLEYVELSTEVDTIIGPGYTNTKYFAVQNVGDISASYYLYLVDVENTFNRKNDIVYTIYRKAYDYSVANTEPESFDTTATYAFSEWENVTNTYCPTVSEYTDYGDCQYPDEKSQLSKQKQTIMEKDDYYVYAFVVTYINQPDIDQIDDEESIFSGKIKVYADESGTDVSPFDDGTLADAIVENALANKNGTIYSETPLTTPGIEVSGENEATLSLTQDNYGASYYYRGNVQDNYINFAGMCWRIVRIQGDGSIKIILASQNGECQVEGMLTENSALLQDDNGNILYNDYGTLKNVFYNGGTATGYIDGTDTEVYDSSGYTLCRTVSEITKTYNGFANYTTFLQKILAPEAGNKMYDDDGIYIGTGPYGGDVDCYGISCNFGNYNRITLTSSYSLLAELYNENNYVDSITADEVILAGATTKKTNNTLYLTQNVNNVWWTSTAMRYEWTPDYNYNYYVTVAGSISYELTCIDGTCLGGLCPGTNYTAERPVLVLKKGTVLDNGEGTQSNPYKIVVE